MNKLYSIQFLRFVAAIAVANHHFLYTLSLATGSEQHILLGAAGVDVFFVISGVVIGLCIQDKLIFRIYGKAGDPNISYALDRNHILHHGDETRGRK